MDVLTDPVALTPAMLTVFAVLALTIYLFVSEIVRVDVAALTIMVSLGLLTQVPGLEQVADTATLFDGFASNAVMAIVAVMILGAGLDKTGLMKRVAEWIVKVGGRSEWRITLLITTTAAMTSTFIQNIGTAALFLPVVSRVAARTGIATSRLMIPMGFCVILGGNVTMVGSGPLILLNDLIANANRVLPPERHIDSFFLFATAPVGLALVAAGVAYFVVAGRFVLPDRDADRIVIGGSKTAEYFKRVYGLDADIFEVWVPEHSRLVGRRIDVAERAGNVRILGHYARGDKRVAPGADVTIQERAVLAVMGGPQALKRMVDSYQLVQRPQLKTFAEDLMVASAGISEIVVPPVSSLIGKTVREVLMRQTYGVATLAIYRGGDTIVDEVRETPLRAGDTLICHSTWECLTRLERDRNFVVVTADYPHEELRPQKVTYALAFFAFALGLEITSELPLAVALLVGSMGMIVSGVLSIDEAYAAVSWKTVFLLASLIPLGQSMESTGAAAWIATQAIGLLEGLPIWAVQTALALLATALSMVVSNIGATVMLVPLAINIALGVGADPGLFALTVAVATANAFLIPTHQVNALILGPGGYRVGDFVRAGGIMTVLFLLVLIPVLNFEG